MCKMPPVLPLASRFHSGHEWALPRPSSLVPACLLSGPSEACACLSLHLIGGLEESEFMDKSGACRSLLCSLSTRPLPTGSAAVLPDTVSRAALRPRRQSRWVPAACACALCLSTLWVSRLQAPGEGLAHSAHLVPARSFPLSDLMPLGSLQAIEKNRHFLNGKDCWKMLI